MTESRWLDDVCRRLADDYPGIPVSQIHSAANEIHDATVQFGVPAKEQPQLIEIIMRNQLRLRTGELPDAAHLDPQTHRGGMEARTGTSK